MTEVSFVTSNVSNQAQTETISGYRKFKFYSNISNKCDDCTHLNNNHLMTH